MNRVLIVCDEKKREIFEEALFDFIKNGAEVYFAKGEEALSLLSEKKMQLIFADEREIQEHLLIYQKQHLVLLSKEWEKMTAMKKKKHIQELCNKNLNCLEKIENVPLL